MLRAPRAHTEAAENDLDVVLADLFGEERSVDLPGGQDPCFGAASPVRRARAFFVSVLQCNLQERVVAPPRATSLARQEKSTAVARWACHFGVHDQCTDRGEDDVF